MDWNNLNDNIALILGIGGGGLTILGAGWTVLRFCVRPCKRFVKSLYEDYNKIKEDIGAIKKETTINGGGSLKDAIIRIERTVYNVSHLQRARLSYERDGFFECDERGDWVFVNRALLHILESSDPNQVLGLGWKTFLHHARKEEVVEEWEACVKDKRDFKMPVRYITPNGQVKCCSVEALCQRDGRNNLIGFIGNVVVRDGVFCEDN